LTYCRAWKKEKTAFLLSDTCVSEKDGKIDSYKSSFGESFGIYNNYSVSESEIKIVTINNNIAIAYSGKIEKAKEAIDNFINSMEHFDVKNSLAKLEATYDTNEFELIVVCMESNQEIYYFNGSVCTTIEKYIEIGSGKDDKDFCDKINKFIETEQYEVTTDSACCLLSKNDKLNPDKHLVNVIAYVQFLSKDKNMFSDGVGGLFSGLYLNKEIIWCRDLLYYIFDGDINKFKTVSVVERFNSVFSYSDYNKILRYYCNGVNDDEKLVDDEYAQNSIIKSLIESFPDYVAVYNIKDKIIAVLETDKWPYNQLFKMWIRRRKDETKYAFLFSSIFMHLNDIIINSSKDDLDLYNLKVGKVPFEIREDCVGALCSNIEDVEDFDIEYDYDLRSLEFNDGYSSDKFSILDNTMSKYHNIIIVDYRFLYEIINEKYNQYKFAGVRLEQLELKLLIKKNFAGVSSQEFNEYGFYIIKSKKDNKYIDKFSLTDWIKEYDNCTLIEVDDDQYEKELISITLKTITEYYYDEKYFCIDKLILFCDNCYINEILQYVPKINMETENPNILLVRKLNDYTQMDGRFRYVLCDKAVAMMLGYNEKEFLLLESEYDPRKCR